MTRVLIACAMLTIVLSALAVPAAAAAGPVDQAGWVAGKRHVQLPNGIRLAYAELGNPAGPPVLLLHGFTDSSRAWTALAPYLEGHRLLIPDQRGHGGSSRPDCCYAVSDLAHDALLFLDAIGVERADVVGHSLGSMVAQRLAAEHPNRVERVVLAGSTALAPVGRGDWLWEQVMALKAPVASNRAFLSQWSLGASPTPVDPELVRHADAEAAGVPLHVWRAVPRELLATPAGRYAPDIEAPVLILSGGRDELFPAEHHRALVAAFPEAEARIFPELGHNFIVERPHEVGPAIAAFLRR